MCWLSNRLRDRGGERDLAASDAGPPTWLICTAFMHGYRRPVTFALSGGRWAAVRRLFVADCLRSALWGQAGLSRSLVRLAIVARERTRDKFRLHQRPAH